ncbi:hypothetical protein [Streptomyces decoyicus]|uniref:hypothetical protein n=1 Tax=Streptomyces decoyicus TaxID=249567 RepID=UPI00386CB4D0
MRDGLAFQCGTGAQAAELPGLNESLQFGTYRSVAFMHGVVFTYRAVLTRHAVLTHRAVFILRATFLLRVMFIHPETLAGFGG